MDIIGKEALEEMLNTYEGTVLFVSHDRYFISRIATGILEFSDGTVKQYAGKYEDYLAEEAKEAVTQMAEESQPTLDDVFDKKTYYNPGKIRSRLKRQLEKYETMLSDSESRLAELKLQFMDPALASDYPKLVEIQEAIDAEEKNQESLLERMLETETGLAEMDVE